MTTKLMKRLSLDLLMVVLVLLEFAYRLTGSTLHELIGLSMFTAFVVHGAWNWRWFTTLFKGGYSGLRIASMVVNVVLLITVTLMISSGLFNSDLLSFLLGIELDLLPRQLHTACAYGLLMLMGVHLGMHWTTIMAQARKLAGNPWAALPATLRKVSLRCVAALVAGYGIPASFERHVFARLTAYYSFGNRELDEPLLRFFVQYVAIVGLYGYLAYQVLRFCKGRSRSSGPGGSVRCA